MGEREDRFGSSGGDFFQRFCDLSLDMLCIKGFDGFFKKVDPAMIKTLGWMEEELLSRPWIEFVQPEDHQLTEAASRNLLEGNEVVHLENRFLDKGGSSRWLSWTWMPEPDRELIFAVARDITRQKQLGENLRRHQAGLEEQVQERTAVLMGINRIFREALFCETEEQLGRVFLAVAEELTESKFGYLSEVDSAGRFQTMAISNPGWSACHLPKAEALPLLKDSEVRGIRGLVIKSGESLFFNDPASHPSWVEPPQGHPPLFSFLGVPLKLSGKAFGMIGLANREGGYSKKHQQDVETLAVAVVEALMRKRAEWKLAQVCQRHEFILSSASEGILGLDLDGNMTFVNPAASHMLGYQVEELVGRHAHTLWHHTKPDGSPYPQEECRVLKTLREGDLCPLEDDFFWRKDGTGFPVICGTNPIIQNGCISGAVITFQDISQRKQVEEALRKSEEVYRQIVETALEGIWTIDAQDRVVLANSRLAEMLGYSLDEVIGAPLAKFMDQEWAGVAATTINERVRKGLREQLDLKLRCKEGLELWVILTASPIFDQEGRYAGALGMVTDITARKHSEEVLRQSEEKFRRTFDQSPIGAAMVGLDFRYQRVNAELCRITGYSEEELAARTFVDITHPDDVTLDVKLAGRLAAGKIDHYSLEKRYLRKDGSTVWVRLSVRLLRDAAGLPLYYLPMIQDITPHKRAEENLQQSFNRLQKALGDVVRAMALIVEVRDPYTAGHQRRVTQLAQAIAWEMALPKEQQEAVWCAGTLHDLGKVYVPESILSRTGKLSDIEFAMIKTHSQKGYEILQSIEFPWPVAEIVRQHHERLNGSGYPDGLQGEEILLEARILGVADVVEAMASHRPYRQALGIDAALEEISRNRGVLFDPDAVDACLKVFKEKAFAFE